MKLQMKCLNIGEFVPPAKIVEIMLEAKFDISLGHIVSVDSHREDTEIIPPMLLALSFHS